MNVEINGNDLPPDFGSGFLGPVGSIDNGTVRLGVTLTLNGDNSLTFWAPRIDDGEWDFTRLQALFSQLLARAIMLEERQDEAMEGLS